jgi:hypothetical protein
MPQVRTPVRSGAGNVGGIAGYPLDRLYEEVAFIAYHFHWSHEEIMGMEHWERHRWVEEISKINRRQSGETERSILDVA